MDNQRSKLNISETNDDRLQDELDEEIELQRRIMDNEEHYDPFVITFLFNSRSILYGFTAKGSTGFVQYGLDIIAAGVSALIINTVHSIQYLTNDEPSIEMHNKYVKCIVDALYRNKGSAESKVLLRSLEMGIHSIQNTYGEKYITIEEVREEEDKQGMFSRFFGR
ncbi:ribosomal-processing cysteine protease Prp [Paenibacillus sp. TH7-28]